MQEAEKKEFSGSLKISHEVVASIAEYAIAELEGVGSIAPVNSGTSLGWLLEKQTVKPISIAIRDGVAIIDLRIYVCDGAKIPELTKKIQENIKEAVQNMTGIVVSKVNLYIAGIKPRHNVAAV